MSVYYDTEILVLQEITGVTPPNSIWDTTVKKTFSSWALNEAAAFSFFVQTGFVPGSNLVLLFNERSGASYKKHQWSASVTVTVEGVTSGAEVFVGEFLSEFVADTMSIHQITISGPTGDHVSANGEIHAITIVAGATVNIELTRIAASSDEDAEEIEISEIIARQILSTDGDINCFGRVGDIATEVYEQFNIKPGSGHASLAMIVRWINECKDRIAREGYWSSTQDINMTSGTQDYDLSVLITDHTYVKVKSVQYINGTVQYSLKPITRRQRFDALCTSWASSTIPLGYFMEGDTMKLCPSPELTVAGGLRVEFYYTPADLDCTVNYTPPSSVAYDTIYVNFCLYKAYGRDRHAPLAAQLRQAAFTEFRADMRKLLRQGRPRIIVLKPYR